MEAVDTNIIIIRLIRDNSHKLNFSLLITKVYKMAKQIFREIQIMYH